MKLYEILSKPIPNIQKSTRPTTTRWGQYGPHPIKHLPQLGVDGGQSAAYLHEPSGKVVKVSILYNKEQDPIYQFIRMCLKHQDNPHFPTIYSVKQYPDDNNGMRLIITMEQLYQMDWDDIKTYVKMLGIDPNDWSQFDKLTLSRHVRDLLGKTNVRHKIYKMTSDPSLKQAMKLLEPLFRNYGADMHFDNVMIRRTSSGPQLVFMDPVTYR
jgi:hypothetical protein